MSASALARVTIPVARWAARFLRPRQRLSVTACQPQRILALGVYLADRPNTADHVVNELARSDCHTVTQRWARIGSGKRSPSIEAHTVLVSEAPMPKFALLNRLLEGVRLADYDLLFITDDDITLPHHFVDAFVHVQTKCGFSLCQPARTRSSWIDHPFVAQQEGLLARRTRFVEIGPLFSLRADLYDCMLPFDDSTPMGWGLDFVWPVKIEQLGKAMGIIDAVPVCHAMRKPVAHYDRYQAMAQMHDFLLSHPHLTHEEAFTVQTAFPLENDA